MATNKRPDYLSLSRDSESGSDAAEGGSEAGYDSEEHEGRAARASKRRKTVPVQDEGVDEEAASSDAESLASNGEQLDEGKRNERNNDSEHEKAETLALSAHHAKDLSIPTSKTTISSKKSTRTKTRLKTGIIYLPNLPPFLKPSALRSLLTPYTRHGISRLFLTPEAPAARRQRLLNGGNKKVLYTDGWVEFASKSDAKLVVDACNGNIIGGKKGGYYRDDVWSMRYLKGFKWGDLVGERRDEEAERTSRLDAERRREKREVAVFLGNVEKAKMGETRKRKAERRDDSQEIASTNGEEERMRGGRERKFHFRQNEVKRKTGNDKAKDRPGEDVQRVLSRIF